MSSLINILVLEDDPAHADLMILELRRAGIALDWRLVSTEREYLEALDPEIDVILADYSLPGFNALAALEHLAQSGLAIPFIVVTGMLGDEAAVDCIKQGATDYLLKDRLKRLGPAVARAVESRRLALDRERAKEQLRRSEQAAAEALQQANARLERNVQERTRALSEANARLRAQIAERQKVEEQLRQAQKMEAVGQLSGGVAHDFNNLLTSIIGNLDLALRKEGDEKVARLLRQALTASERGARLTAQLLAFGRGQMLATASVDINQLVSGLEAMLASTLTPAITILLAPDARLWPALADSTQIELALLNLAINARDAMPTGGTLRIATRNVAPDDPALPGDLTGAAGYVALVVSDDGAGMAETVAKRAFEPFFTTKEVGKGSGLGLSMVYGVVKQLGGTVTLESAPGRGTTVAIYLPRADIALAKLIDERVETALPINGVASPVLVVDDDPLVRDTTANWLREFGYDVLEADSGPSALAILDGNSKVDILVTDLVMPGMHGYALASEARLRRPGMPVILITGYTGFASETGLDEREFPVLHKPFRPSELAGIMISCLRN
ncbi:MAG: response regulator [Sphingomonas sp.]|nr:response regulator [Sphingomonas sp.]MCX8477364.1 response regulator [Sphingomonas sp.]